MNDNSTQALSEALTRHARLTAWVRMLLWAHAVATLIMVPAGLMVIWEMAHLPPGHDLAEDVLGSEFLSGCLALVWLPIGLALYVLFLRWIYKTSQFLHWFGSEKPTFSPGWSVGWYFVPIALLFKPYQAMKEIWRLSHGGGEVDEDLLSLWWFLWIVSNIVGAVVLRVGLGSNPADTAHWLPWVELAHSVVDVALAFVALRLVHRLATALQRTFKAGPPAERDPAPDLRVEPIGP